jgi:diguanylate cyclase (GGDEF)-like protein
MKVLIADDDRGALRTLERIVREWGFEPVVACDGNQAWQILSGNDPPPLALLDWMMPGADGVEICRKLRATERGSYVRVIMVTGRNETSDLVEAINAGADDFIAKPVNTQELRVRLRAGQRIAELEQSLRFQASHDPLTGVFNRAELQKILQRELARAARTRHATAVLMVDLDHFKRVNDSFGHQAGDLVLEEVTRRMTRAVRPFDSLGRYGGEEFLIVLPDCDAHQAWGVAERIRECIRARPVQSPRGVIALTISIGGSVGMGGSKSAESLVHESDTALYRAKTEGRDRVRFQQGPRE